MRRSRRIRSSLVTYPWLQLLLLLLLALICRSNSGKDNVTICQEWQAEAGGWREVCCQGYAGSPGNCQPLCIPKCVNAQCTAPQVCTCNEGYVKLDADPVYNTVGCQPMCRICHYGDCIAPGYCRCWPGFVRRQRLGCQPLPQLLLPPEQCLTSNCSCWRRNFSWMALMAEAPKCVHICQQGEQATSCLQLKDCTCNRLHRVLICQVSDRTQQFACAEASMMSQQRIKGLDTKQDQSPKATLEILREQTNPKLLGNPTGNEQQNVKRSEVVQRRHQQQTKSIYQSDEKQSIEQRAKGKDKEDKDDQTNYTIFIIILGSIMLVIVAIGSLFTMYKKAHRPFQSVRER